MLLSALGQQLPDLTAAFQDVGPAVEALPEEARRDRVIGIVQQVRREVGSLQSDIRREKKKIG